MQVAAVIDIKFIFFAVENIGLQFASTTKNDSDDDEKRSKAIYFGAHTRVSPRED